MKHSQAKSLTSEQRKQIALQVVSNNYTVIQMAEQYQISRKFIRQQKNKAIAAIHIKFKAQTEPSLFYLTVTKSWINQTALTLMLTCKASYRNIKACMETLFNYDISVGTVFNIAQKAITAAK